MASTVSNATPKTTGPKSNVQVPTSIVPEKPSFFSRLSSFFVKNLTKSNVPVNVNQSFVEVLNKPEPITVLGFQTGMGRNNEVIPKTNQSIVGNVTLNKKKYPTLKKQPMR